MQRGGTPTFADRLLGTRLGAAAVERLANNEFGVLVGLIKGEIAATPLDEVVAGRKPLDRKLVELARESGYNRCSLAFSMPDTYHIYCDESCHLENDRQAAMVLGGLWCPAARVREAYVAIRALKEKHGLAPDFEVKWTKVSPAKLAFYRELVDYFFENPSLHFRALIVPDKTKLRHGAYGQTHDDWYYKMYFDLLKVVLERDSVYRIFLDIKDTRSALKVAKLHDVLTNNMYDFDRNIVRTVQNVHSHEIELLQLCDLLLGSISYANRGLAGSPAKQALVEHMRRRSRLKLTLTTLLREEKVNLFRWKAGDAEA